MAKKLNEDQILQFVSLYRENPCLWDTSSEDYKNKAMRQFALQKMCDGMDIKGFTVEDVRNKIKIIRSTYYLELDKIKKSLATDASGFVYRPKLKWFAEFNSFIRSVTVKRKTHENVINTVKAVSTNQCGDSTRKKPETNLSEPREKRRKTSQLTPKKSETGEDEFDVFGKHVAKQLRTLSPEQAIIGQEEIQSVITECRLRDLKCRTTFAYTQVRAGYKPGPSTSMPANSPTSTVGLQSSDDPSADSDG